MYCPICQAAFRNRLISERNAGGEHHAQFRSLHQSAQAGCESCGTLVSQLRRAVGDDTIHDLRTQNIAGPCTSYYYMIFHGCYRVCFHFDYGWMDNARLQEAVRYGLDVVGYLVWQPITTQSENGTSDRLAVGDNTGCSSTWRTVRMWLQTCHRQHRRCKRSIDSSWTPTRLIYLQDQQRLRLYVKRNSQVENVSSQNRKQYITLSHRWGSDSMAKLTRENLEAYIASIEVERLPQAFKDAIEIAIRMEVQYIWIDALCIIQGDEEDWRHEATLMERVYGNSLLNISAAEAEINSGGCFFDRDPSLIQPCPVLGEHPGPVPQGQSWVVIKDDFWRTNVDHAPLNHRGWVLQERVLAPRVLHFRREQLFWECRELRACETFPYGVHQVLTTTPKTRIEITSLTPGILLEEYGSESQCMRRYYWAAIVEAYSRCELTKPEDKLIALSGIARTLQDTLGYTYLAGLWKECLPYELLWHVRKSNASSRPPSYIAPSWSWASVNGHIWYPTTISSMWTSLVYLRILEAHVTPFAGSNPTGQVTGGFLRVRGRLGRVSWTGLNSSNGVSRLEVTSIPSRPNCPSSSFGFRCTEDNDTWINLDATQQLPDSDRGEELSSMAFGLPVSRYGNPDQDVIYGLLLQQLPSEKFQRVGAFSIWNKENSEILGCFIEREIVIV